MKIKVGDKIEVRTWSSDNKNGIIKSINICNTSDAANATASVHILVAGASPANNNKIISNANIIKNDVLFYNTSIVVPVNSNVYVASSNSSVTFNISGVEYA